ncbi:MAG: hypothetical protein HY966_06440 [Ignavibacteriales bacterium]|nr:hypothetical protein [Ignavibacteriales bacterium]
MNKNTRTILQTLTLLCVAALTAAAHHGKDFLVASSCSTPHQGLTCAHVMTDYTRANDMMPSTLLIMPGMLYGFTKDLAGEFHGHVMHSDGSYDFESMAFEMRYRFLTERTGTAADFSVPISIAAALEWEPFTHGGVNALTGTFIIGRSFGPVSIVGNVIASRRFGSMDDMIDTRFAFGVRSLLSGELGTTVELASGEHDAPGTQLTLGLGGEIFSQWDLKLGARFTPDQGSVRFSGVQSMLMFTF